MLSKFELAITTNLCITNNLKRTYYELFQCTDFVFGVY